MTQDIGDDGRRFHQAERGRIRARRWGHPLAYINRRLPLAIEAAVGHCALPADARVLDYGCADLPYRHLFPSGADYLGADLPGNPDARLQIRADGSLPVADAGVDVVLSSQVLEHVADPGLYLREAYRVLRPGGSLVLSTHGIMIYHKDPVDYWRWTGEGLNKAVADVGFEVTRFEGVMGLAPTGLQLFQDATWVHLPRLLRRPYALLMQSLIALFDRMHSPASRRMNALVYIINARKPRQPNAAPIA